MPANLLERHGLDRDELAPVIEAFAAGEVERALALTPDAVVDALSIAGTPEDWVQRLRHDVLPTGVDHLLLSFADPYTVSRGAAERSTASPTWPASCGSSATR